VGPSIEGNCRNSSTHPVKICIYFSHRILLQAYSFNVNNSSSENFSSNMHTFWIQFINSSFYPYNSHNPLSNSTKATIVHVLRNQQQ
jgi:hypothetical protein